MLTLFATAMFFGAFICLSAATYVFIYNIKHDEDGNAGIETGTMIFCIALALAGSFSFTIGLNMVITDVMFYRAYG